MANRISTLRKLAKRLRRNETDAERKLWMWLRARQVNGLKFRRQHPIDRYVVDFCCPERRIVVELDGSHHAGRVQADQRRTDFLAQYGFRVLRFWDHEVLTDPEAVLQQIINLAESPSPQPSPFKGEGNGKSQ